MLDEFVKILRESLDVHVFGGVVRSGVSSVVVADTVIISPEVADEVTQLKM